jgi:hypothetical protein
VDYDMGNRHLERKQGYAKFFHDNASEIFNLDIRKIVWYSWFRNKAN